MNKKLIPVRRVRFFFLGSPFLPTGTIPIFFKPMKTLENYINPSSIIECLSSYRAKIAHRRNHKHLLNMLSGSDDYDYLEKEEANIARYAQEKDICDMLPRRRMWRKLRKIDRYKNNQRINSITYNKKALIYTIKYFRKNKPDAPFLKKLDAFIAEVLFSVNDKDYLIKNPDIIPMLKDEKQRDTNKCRPISQFSLKDKIIISLINRYLTDCFDNYFFEGSTAFRAKRPEGTPTHHDAIQSIRDYRGKYTSDHLWVAECDIAKFYDSVHHTPLKKLFRRLANKAAKDSQGEFDPRAERIFNKYLDCYSFPKSVLPYNDPSQMSYWKKHNIPGGNFGWVEDMLKKQGFFKNARRAKIGVPQGGALSGLIANIMLDYADRQMEKLKDPDLHYVRFCDDMIIIHPDEDKCLRAAEIYREALEKLHLIPHPYQRTGLTNKKDSFWSKELKSKGPYRWSSDIKDSFPWFGFVGYEIHYNGDIRVRRKTLLKEKKKQKKVIDDVIRAAGKYLSKSKYTIFESAANRLIGMSVGRVNLINFETSKDTMCWLSGFKKINDNKHSRRQMKELDRSRHIQLSRLIKTIKKLPEEKTQPTWRVGKFAFTAIRGISDKQSESIHNQLIESGILTKKFKVNPSIKVINPNLDFGLSPEFIPFKENIREVLINPVKDRFVGFYGKPFSYYYHGIEKAALMKNNEGINNKP